ncbi:MAG: prepilin-type N-terminal cleavage/methylation domain-containing protein, partial [Phycisphaerales bacterium]|nr:prepilin-type N-terminal cleavage/methylation domain-containing protein [Phycisphaerales bacterium]
MPGRGFTLIEVMVVVAIIALLISILLPSLVAAKRQAHAAMCLSNQKQIGIGLCGYVLNNKDRYPKHSSPSSAVPRTRWPDYMHAYMKDTEVYTCPSLSERQERDFKKPFAHTVDRATGAETGATRYHGGYGYNFQYLGNARTKTGGQALAEWAVPYHATLSEIRMPGNTLAVADTRGSRKGDLAREPGEGSAAVYVVDPPLGSEKLGSRGSRGNSNPATGNMWYEGGTEIDEEEKFRSRP